MNLIIMKTDKIIDYRIKCHIVPNENENMKRNFGVN